MKERLTLSDHSLERPVAYKEQIEQIYSRTLSPEEIDTYADEALNDLIGLIQVITSRYSQLPTIASDNSRGSEESAFRYFDLVNIEGLLDHIANLSESIYSLNDTIEQANKADAVFIPPQQIDAMEIEAGSGTFDQKKLIPRLKTVLFIMEQDLQIDLNNQVEFHLEKGKVTESAMRGASYYSILTPAIDRLSFINDEEGNASYVFDLKGLSESGIDYHDLSNFTKTQLNDLIASTSGIGKRIVYSKEYINNIRDALSNPFEAHNSRLEHVQTPKANKNTYLLPKIPADHKSLSAVARALHKGNLYIEEAVVALGPKLGEVGTYLSGVRTTTAFSPEQQNIINEHITTKDGQPAPEGYQSARALGRLLNIRADAVRSAVERLGNALGELKEYRFKTKTTIGYSPEQQQIIRDYLNSNDLLTEKAPSGYLSAANIAKQYRLSDSVIHGATSILSQTLGEVSTYRLGTITAAVYSPEQQQIIHDYLGSINALAEKAPDGHLSARGLSQKLNTNYDIVQRAIVSINDRLGDVQLYKFGSKVTAGYSSEQCEIIEIYLKEHSLYYNSTKGIAKTAIAQTSRWGSINSGTT